MKALAMCVMVLSLGCGRYEPVRPTEYITYGYTVLPEREAEYVEALRRYAEASNPMSDEELEDMMAQAEESLLPIYGVPTVGMRVGGVFIPYHKLSERQQVQVDCWMDRVDEDHPHEVEP